MHWYYRALKKYAAFGGRARRREFWLYALFNAIIYSALLSIDLLTGAIAEEGGRPLLAILYYLATFLPGLAVSVRRLHDTNRSGWWVLLPVAPILGPIIFIVFLATDSDPNENSYGLNPKAIVDAGI